jgi:hypothetical protein
LAGKQAAQIWRILDEIPKCLLPKINNAGTIKPMILPAAYLVHGCFKNSIIQLFFKPTIKDELQVKKRVLENSRKFIDAIYN